MLLNWKTGWYGGRLENDGLELSRRPLKDENPSVKSINYTLNQTYGATYMSATTEAFELQPTANCGYQSITKVRDPASTDMRSVVKEI